MKALQVFYTSCRRGSAPGPGFQIRAFTLGIQAEELREIERRGVYRPPRGAALMPSDEEIARDFPRALRYYPLNSGRWALTLASYTGRDYSGRWGNFFNEEAFGRPTDLPWKLFISPPNRPLQYAQAEFFHPTFLYESLWDLTVFLLLVFALRSRLKRAPGALFLAYLGLYSLGRLFTEGLRTDPLMLGPLRIAQLVSLLGMAVAAVGVPLLLRQPQRPA